MDADQPKQTEMGSCPQGGKVIITKRGKHMGKQIRAMKRFCCCDRNTSRVMSERRVESWSHGTGEQEYCVLVSESFDSGDEEEFKPF